MEVPESLDTIPLCVDLDGTLTPVDTLHESVIALMRRSPLELPRLVLALSGGRAAFKRTVVDRLVRPEPGSDLPVALDITVPLRQDFLDYLAQQRAAGRRLVLVTAAEHRIANTVAVQAGCFDEVLATEGAANLSAETKRDVLVARYGLKGFDYAGNSRDDLAVWPFAREAIVVNASPSVLRRARESAAVTGVFATPSAGLATWLRAIRTHQWVKNLLVFLPLLLAHQVGNHVALVRDILAFFAFSTCASSVYLLNDLLDLPSDRRHPRKRRRPMASGEIPAVQGGVATVLLFALSILLGSFTTGEFLIVLGAYYLVTLAYSFVFKRQALIDVMLLAGLYTVRIIAGGAAAAIAPSFWLLSFAIFMFLSLGIIKRYTELELIEEGTKTNIHGRGYSRHDMPLLLGLGAASGFIAVLVLALYINSPEALPLYRRPRILWLLCPLVLYWISRVWLKCSRGEMHDDPIVFAIKDRSSLLIGLLGAVIMLSAS